MDIKRYILVAFILCGGAFLNSAVAQSKDRTFLKVFSILTSHLTAQGAEIIVKDTYKNRAYVFSFALYVNAKGMVDSVRYTNISDELDSLISIKVMSNAFKTEKHDFQEYKNTMLVGIVYLRRSWDDSIENIGYLDKTFSSLIDPFESIPGNMKVRLLPTFSLVQRKPSFD